MYCRRPRHSYHSTLLALHYVRCDVTPLELDEPKLVWSRNERWVVELSVQGVTQLKLDNSSACHEGPGAIVTKFVRIRKSMHNDAERDR